MLHFFQLSRRISLAGILLFCIYGSSFAQSQEQATPFPAYKPFDIAELSSLPAELNDPISQGTIHILAVMVEFEPEDNRFTSGDGTFELEYLMRDDIIIDPLPHDQGYFEAHLDFAVNYFQQASSGLLDIEYTVLPQVYRLNQPMREYSPTGPDDSENFRLGDLFYDTWTMVANSNLPDLSFLPQDRTMFVIFHAGAGRDIELVGTILDNTPQDIPSVFLDRGAITRLSSSAGPDFDGIPLPGGPRVTNSAILPQTQSRRGEDVTGAEIVLQLSINGILTANVGSFLGIPDLFNTETGASGIGQFGLMDGAGIFSYYGLFPPLPSAWERIYMGWDNPFDISLNDDEPVTLPAVGLGGTERVARHRISTDEYFLVENRHRDPLGTGVELTFRLPDGSIETRTFDNEEERFSPTDQSDYDEIFPAGVLVNVSNFDWSLPGGLDVGEDGIIGSDDDRILNGGMLIWHIDEAVIRNTIDDNAINNNPDRRGIALQEADGAQDIGRPAQGLTNFSNGGPFDFWWSGNDFTVITPTGRRIVLYENRFADDTFPNNRSNTGSSTFFEFYDFSENLPVSSFRARTASSETVNLLYEGNIGSGYGQMDGLFYAWPQSPSLYTSSQGTPFLLVPSLNSVTTFPLNDESGIDEAGRIDLPSGTGMPLFTNEGVLTVSEESDGFTASFFQYDESAGTFETIWQTGIPEAVFGIPSTVDGQLIDIDTTPARLNSQTGDLQLVTGGFQQSAVVGGVQTIIENGQLITTDGRISRNVGSGQGSRMYAATVRINADASPQPLLITDTKITLLAEDSRDDITLAETSGYPGLSWPALVDFNDDGSLDFLFINYNENRLEGRNDNGAFLWDFPLDAPDGQRFLSTPIVADITGDGRADLIVPSADSLSYIIHAFDYRLNPIDGFPLYVGSLSDDPLEFPLQPVLRDNLLYAVSSAGDLKIWELDGTGEVFWGSVYGNDPGNKITADVPSGGQPIAGFGLLNADETYNWPNPATNETWIRYQTSGEADITITVSNMSGTRVFERRVQSRGGTPEEVLVDTSGWSSGVYYARVRASQSGREETRLIKIAVIR